MRDKQNIVQHEETKAKKKGCVDPDFITNHKLTMNTNMEYYVEIVIPLKNNTHGKKKMLSFDMVTIWFNMKAILDRSEKKVTPY